MSNYCNVVPSQISGSPNDLTQWRSHKQQRTIDQNERRRKPIVIYEQPLMQTAIRDLRGLRNAGIGLSTTIYRPRTI